MAALGCVGYQCGHWRSLWQFLDPRAQCDVEPLAWHDGYELHLPFEVDLGKLAKTTLALKEGLVQAGVQLLGLHSRTVFPEEFNRLTKSFDNKSETLSRITLELLGEVLDRLPGRTRGRLLRQTWWCNFYTALLQRQFPEWLVEVYCEGCDESIYRFGPADRRVEVGFRVASERYLPAALASMIAKYLREVLMRPFNDFWCAPSPGCGQRPDIPAIHIALRQRSKSFNSRWESTIASWALPLTLLGYCTACPSPTSPIGRAMKLYIIRHGLAGEHGDPRYPDDRLRPLTDEGRKRFTSVVKHLADTVLEPDVVATSPLVRCRQTAEIVVVQVRGKPKLVELAALEPGSDLDALIEWTNEQQVEAAAWVGHAPDVSDLAAGLLSTSGDSAIRFAKGAVACIAFDAAIRRGGGELQWLMTAKTLGL